MAKASDNVFPKVIHGMQTSDPSAPTDSSWKTYAKADGIYARSSNGVVGPFGAGSTFSAAGSNAKNVSGRSYAGDSTTLLAPFDHEHLGVVAITSSSSNTLQRPTVNLRPGTNIGFALSDTDGNGAFDTLTITAAGGGGSSGGAQPFASGTGFPGSPATNDFFYRTDRSILYFYDGTRWLSNQLFTVNANWTTGISTSATEIAHAGSFEPTYDIYIVELRGMTVVSTTNDGTKFWTVAVKKASDSSTIGSFNTSADTASTITSHLATINAVSTEKGVFMDVTKTSTPGAISPYVLFTYRLVG